MHTILSLLVLLTLRPGGAFAKTYYKTKDYMAHGVSGFFDSFDFFSQGDPTHGTVEYVDRNTAYASQLIDPASSSSIYIGVDQISVLSSLPGAPGRKSVRIESKERYNPGTLIVADIRHAPTGCGVWPALWMLGAPPWPRWGEIDIMEQVNLASVNSVTLHTNEACTLNNQGTAYSGSLIFGDCNSAGGANGNRGCGIAAIGKGATFGAQFNNNGGGIYVTEWKRHAGFNVWFFSHAGEIPDTLKTDHPDTSKLGKPIAAFYGEGCKWSDHFKDMQIIINTSFCGDWAGDPGVWASSGCPALTGGAPCDSYVRNNPQAFSEAYWKIKSLKVFKRRDESGMRESDESQHVMGGSHQAVEL